MLRTVTHDDVDAIMHIVTRAGLFEPADREFIAGAVTEFVESSPNSGGGFLLDFADGKPVGVVSWRPRVATDAVWEVTMIAVDPSHQDSGLGTGMLTHVEAELIARGQRLLLVETSSTGQYAAARAFYLRRGYDEEARVRDYWTDGDDLVLFRKQLKVGA